MVIKQIMWKMFVNLYTGHMLSNNRISAIKPGNTSLNSIKTSILFLLSYWSNKSNQEPSFSIIY